MWGLFDKKVEVSFVDEATGKPFARSAMPPDSLPETFAIDTTMHLPSGDWRVVAAEPLRKEEFAKSRRLRLVLARVAKPSSINPDLLLYTLPTITGDAIPADGPEADGRELELHEDDWRQVEWVHVGLRELLARELAGVKAIFEHDRQGLGFRKIHVRKLPTDAAAGLELRLEDVLAWAGVANEAIRGVRLRGVPRRVRDGFAIETRGGWIYGLARGAPGLKAPVLVLGIHGVADVDDWARTIGPPGRGAVLIDWCGAREVRRV